MSQQAGSAEAALPLRSSLRRRGRLRGPPLGHPVGPWDGSLDLHIVVILGTVVSVPDAPRSRQRRWRAEGRRRPNGVSRLVGARISGRQAPTSGCGTENNPASYARRGAIRPEAPRRAPTAVRRPKGHRRVDADSGCVKLVGRQVSPAGVDGPCTGLRSHDDGRHRCERHTHSG